MPPPNKSPIKGYSNPKDLPFDFLQIDIGNSIKKGIIICDIVAQPPVKPPDSKALWGNQNIPHRPAAIKSAKLIV